MDHNAPPFERTDLPLTSGPAGPTAHAAALGMRLQKRVLEEVVPHLAQGLIAQMQAAGPPSGDAAASAGWRDGAIDLDLVWQAALTFLYRLIFVAYAESLELLPVNAAHGYAAVSLRALTREVAQQAGDRADEAPQKLAQAYSATATDLYARLLRPQGDPHPEQALFGAISAGNPAFNLPAYGGGLFAAETPAGRLLLQYAIADRCLALGLDRLTRDVDDESRALVTVDFKALGVRRLGSIYEAALAYKLRIAAEQLAVVKEDGQPVYVPLADVGGRRVLATVNQGDIFLENDKRGRKATGSYYTPAYIVNFIVEHAVGPALDRKFKELEPRLHEAQQHYRQAKERAGSAGADPDLFWDTAAMQQLAGACLDVKVLDPAMGSGHFLVAAADYISHRLLDWLNGWMENPVWALLERTRRALLADMERQQVTLPAERLGRVALLKYAVLQRCIYGVDLDAMAVELAKMSLWLDASAVGAPLSFMDHHLKQGNSLIGCRIEEVQAALQIGWESGLPAASQFAGAASTAPVQGRADRVSDSTPPPLATSRAAGRSAADPLAPYKRLLDLYTSRWFGNGPTPKGGEPAPAFLPRDDVWAWLEQPATPLPAGADRRLAAERALQAAAARHFFHWELEFPEVFLAPGTSGEHAVHLRADGGFDAVIGNPPYANAIEASTARDQAEIDFYAAHYASAQGAVDLYVLFLELGARLTARRCLSAMIVPNKWLAAGYGKALRAHLAAHHSVVRLADFSAAGVFDDAAVYPVVLVAAADSAQSDVLVEVYRSPAGPASRHYAARETVIAWSGVSWGVLVMPSTYLTRQRQPPLLTLGRRYPITASAAAGEAYAFAPFVKEESAAGHESCFRLVTSGSIDRYECLWGSGRSTFLRQSYQRPVLPVAAVTGARRAQYAAGKIIVANLSRVLEAVADEGGAAGAIPTLQLAIPHRGERMYVLALLNSAFFTHMQRVLFGVQALSGGFISFTKEQLGALPLPPVEYDADCVAKRELWSGVREWFARSQEGPPPDTLTVVRQCLADGNSDAVPDLLAFLAEQMTDLNRRKRAETTRFLGWLESRLAIRAQKNETGLDSLTGKSVLQHYLGDYQKGEPACTWADFLHRLQQNRRRFDVPLAAVQDDIRREFAASLALLLPIRQQLATTDRLIDRVVYLLYGLSDAEMEIGE